MKWLCNFVSVVLVLVVSLLSGSPAKAGTPITGPCPIIISQPGEYDLATDVGPCATGMDGIDIRVSDVTLHLDGHNIIGSPDPTACNTSVGIRVGQPAPTPMLSLVRILGTGTISNFFAGLWGENSAGSFAKFLTVTGACTNFHERGLELVGPGGQWKLEGNVVREPGPTSTGIVIFNMDDNDIVRNNVNDTIQTTNSHNNAIINNTANDNEGGIFVGFFGASNNNEIHANTTNNNGSSSGLTIFLGSGGNNITGNKSFGNLPFDMEDDNPKCGTNKWRGNHFRKANQPCIRSGKDDDSGEDEDRKDDDRG